MRPPPKKFVAKPFEYHQELTLDIETLTNLGQGLARVDGWVVMIPFALPHEKVRVRIHRNHKNYSEADLMEVLEPSPHRVEAPCYLFGTCGGCQYQNMAYPQQLEWKRDQVTGLLKHMAQIEHFVEPVIGSPQQYHYRSKITPHFNPPRDGTITDIGFLANSSRYRVIDVPQCQIAMLELNARLTTLRDEVRARAAKYKKAATLLMRASQGEVLTESSQIATEIVDGIRFEFQAGDFFQNNPFILPAFVKHVADEARAGGSRYLIDAYCGSGLFGLSCAKYFEEVIGIEISESSVAKAKHNAELNGITHAKFMAGSAEAIFAGVTRPAADTAVIVDPPRAGCSEDFLKQLFTYGPATVVYVSCNPATQMRDLVKFVEAGYALEKVQPFDLFPQTRHLECVMTFSRPG